MDEHTALLEMLKEDRQKITYRPTFARLTDNALTAILLQQIFYWWTISDGKAFFKFRAPCKHEQYKEGDSWCEELEWTPKEFDGALKVIGTKITKGVSKQSAITDCRRFFE